MLHSIVNAFVHWVIGLGGWAYWIIFAAVCLEDAVFLGLVVPGETLVLIGGFLAQVGTLRLSYLIVLVCVGAIIGDTIGFELGKRLGREWLLQHGSRWGVRRSSLAKSEKFFQRHGGKALYIGRFSTYLRVLIPFVAGSSKMRYRHFIVYNALGGISWGVIFCLIGYYIGEDWRSVERVFGKYGLIFGGIVLAAIIIWWNRESVSGRLHEWRERWRRFLAHPRVAAARQFVAEKWRALGHVWR